MYNSVQQCVAQGYGGKYNSPYQSSYSKFGISYRCINPFANLPVERQDLL
jgi:hypothetical protein